MFDLNHMSFHERQEEQGQQAKDQRHKNIRETSEERLKRNTRFLSTVLESSVEKVSGQQLDPPEQVQEAPENKPVPRKRKYEWKDEEFKKMQSDRMKDLNKKQWEDKEFRKMHSEKMKERWKDEGFRKMQSDKMKEMAKKRWEDEESRKMHSGRMKEKWEDEEFRKMHSDKMKKMQSDKIEKKFEGKFKGNTAKIEAAKRLRERKRTWRQGERQAEPNPEALDSLSLLPGTSGADGESSSGSSGQV